jgi:N-acetyl-anhydromuramyl-L-alanine amidase AmpD
MVSIVDEPGAIPMWVPDSIMFDSTDATWLVLHKTAGFTSAVECAAYFQAGSDGKNVSAHYIVGQDGMVVQCVPESRGAGANCCVSTGHASYLPTSINLNLKTISIEHIDPAIDNSTPLTEAQKAASFQLIQHICQRHHIPMRPGDASGGIIGHADIDPVNRARCPGNYPWSDLWQFLQTGENAMINLQTPGVSSFFAATNDPQVWQCITPGHDYVVGHAILQFYCSFGPGLAGLTNLGLPQSNEQSVTGKPGVVCQQFERGVLFYDPQHRNDNPPGSGPVYVGHIPAQGGTSQLQTELQAAQQKLAQVKALVC